VTSSSRIEVEGERKQVTVLFADVKGSMDLAEQHDPEQWHRIMQGFFSILSDEVRRLEGTVDKFTGDGIMAVFGAPVAHEDHARRACFAALRMLDDIAEYAAELRRTHGLNFSARIGINSGEVIAGEIGSGSDSGYTAVGHTVGLAQRMEALAEPGRAYLTEAAAELAHGFFELEDLGEFEIKGASRPVRVFELVGVGAARSRLDLSRERGFSRFVGREREVAALEQGLERARAGEGAVLGVVAEPGVGKSRLCLEFAQRTRDRGVEVFEAQGQAHGRELLFMPVLQMLRSYFGIADSDSERIVREKIAGRTLLLDPGFVEDLPLLFDFLGVPDPDRPLPQLSAEARQRALQAVVCRLVRAPNRRNPIVTVIEDLHWMDEGSESLLEELLNNVEGTETLILVNFRPEYSPGWDTDSSRYRQIELEPLGPGDTRELLGDLAGDDPSLDGLSELIHERTAGNPFFIEEIVRALVEADNLEGKRGAYRLARPVEETVVPVSVQTVLAARIDRLGPDAKRLLQAASVAGKEVAEPALVAISGMADEEERCQATLRELIEAGFLYEHEVYPERVLAFRHPLTREVAYGTQLGEQRAAIHAAVARATIELNPERHEELAALIASHMEKGGETLDAARWSARAAYWAGHSRPHDSMRLWRNVMELVEGLEETEETTALAVTSRLLQLDYAWRLGMDREEAARLEREAEEIATRIGDLRSLALLRMLRSGRPGIEQTTSAWIEGVAEANRIADESGDPYLRVAIRAAGAYAYLCAADFDRLEGTADEVLELAGGDIRAGAGIVIGCPVAWALGAKAIVARERGEYERCEELLNQSIRIAEELGDPETASWNHGTRALLLLAQGEADAAVVAAQRNFELTERMGDVFSRCLALSNLGSSQLAVEDFPGALATFEEAERVYREAMGNTGDEMQAWRAAERAEALRGVGRVEEAIELAEWAIGVARKRELFWSLPLALQAAGRVRIATGREGARDALDEAAAIAADTGALTTLEAIEAEREALAATRR
jgi:class 3 adenylate cyclase/tetratricopeptide (TPR) repeat protein